MAKIVDCDNFFDFVNKYCSNIFKGVPDIFLGCGQMRYEMLSLQGQVSFEFVFISQGRG